MKHLMLFFVALMFTSPVLAVDDDDEIFGTTLQTRERKSAFLIGPKVGMTMSTMGQPEQCGLYDAMGVSFSGGLATRLRFGKFSRNDHPGTGRCAVGLELKYTGNVMKTCATNEDGKEKSNLSLNYFDAPVFFQFYPVKHWYVEVGPDFCAALGCSPKNLTVTNDFGKTVVFHTNDELSKLKSMDMRIMMGVGYAHPKGFEINARYYIGTSKLAENFNSKVNHLEISLAWMFNAAKF